MSVQGRSLYRRLALHIALVLTLSAILLVSAILVSTRSAADDAYDRILKGSALQIAENTWYHDGVVSVDAPLSAFSMLSAGDQVFYSVVDPKGRVVAGDPDFRPPIPWQQITEGPVVVRATYLDFPVSIAFVGRRMAVGGGNPWAVVMLAQTNNARRSFARGVALSTTVLVGATGLLTILAALLTLFQALSPLKAASAAIARRDVNDLSPLTQPLPTELHPLVIAFNGFMQRLADHRAMTRRLIGDAAHQLRTPVAALGAQMELVSMQTDETSRVPHLLRAGELTRHLGELVNQLINHAMVQHRAESARFQAVDLGALVREEMSELLSRYSWRRLDVELAVPESDCTVMGDPLMLREALKNVLSNALEYGAITLLHAVIATEDGRWSVRVTDDGPGIDPADYDRFRRPFASRGAQRQGASLGLSIVEEVMSAHRGNLRFGRDAAGHFFVLLTFSAA